MIPRQKIVALCRRGHLIESFLIFETSASPTPASGPVSRSDTSRRPPPRQRPGDEIASGATRHTILVTLPEHRHTLVLGGEAVSVSGAADGACAPHGRPA